MGLTRYLIDLFRQFGYTCLRKGTAMADSILPPEDAPMVTCEVCGRQYKKGMPHHAFCSGVPAGSECYMCGAKEDGEDAVDLDE